jgi:DNA-binding NarL/FixJ family response regulator
MSPSLLAPLRVLVVDDHAEFRTAATALLHAEGFVVVGEAATAKQATELAEQQRPDVVVLDIRLPDGNGFAVAQALARLPYPPAVVLVSSREASSYGTRLPAPGSRGFLTKSQLSGAALRALLR